MDRKCDRCKSPMAIGRPRVRVGGKQLWCQTCVKDKDAPSGKYKPGSDIAKAASDWHQFDNNRHYRQGHQDGANGEMTDHAEYSAKVSMGIAEPHEIDYLMGHAAGQDRAREHAQATHDMKKVWEEHGQPYGNSGPSLPGPRTAHLDPADLIGLQNSREFVRSDMKGSVPADSRDRSSSAISHMREGHGYKTTEDLHGLSSAEIEERHQRAHAFEDSKRDGPMGKYMPPMHDHTRRNFDPHRDGLNYSLSSLVPQMGMKALHDNHDEYCVHSAVGAVRDEWFDTPKENAPEREYEAEGRRYLREGTVECQCESNHHTSALEATMNIKIALREAKTGQRIIVVAHDSGDGQTIYHCPFCGSGQVIARSDKTIECEFCHTSFTVQVQPEYSAFPQTMDGQPVQVPGMPGQIDAPIGGSDQDPSMAGAPDPSMDPEAADPAADPAAGGGFDPAAAASPANQPPWLTASLRTATGAELPHDEYIHHLAIKHAGPARPQVLRRVKASRES